MLVERIFAVACSHERVFWMTNSSRKLKGMINSKRLAKIAMALTATTAMAGYGVAYADASNNTVTVVDGETAGNVYGGLVYDGTTYNVKQSSLDKIGGTSSIGNANSNSVVISGGTIEGEIYGGSSEQGNADNNQISLLGGKINAENYDSIYGGFSSSGDVTDNVVFVGKDVEVTGHFMSSIIGGESSDGKVTDNSILIEKGAIVTEDYLMGGSSASGNSENNSVSVESEDLSCRGILGAYSGKGTVFGNSVKIDSGTVTDINNHEKIGVFGGVGVNVRDNNVTINGGNIKADVVGGAGYYLSNNTVNINGGTFEGDIIGGNGAFHDDTGYTGYVGFLEIDPSTDGLRKIENNVINISGNPDLSQSNLMGCKWPISIIDALGDITQLKSIIHDNELNIHTKELEVKNIDGFDSVNFYLPVTMQKGNTILNLTDGVTNLSGMTIKAGVESTADLNDGDYVLLLNNDNGIYTDTHTTYGVLTTNVSSDYKVTVDKFSYNGILAIIGAPSASNHTVKITDDGYEVDGLHGNYNKWIDCVYGGRSYIHAGMGDGVIGGTVDRGSAVNNNVEIMGGKIIGDIYGGLVYHEGNATNNKVTISGGKSAKEDYWAVIGGAVKHFSGLVRGNEVIFNGESAHYVIGGEGGCSYGYGEGIGDVCDNRVKIISGNISRVFGGVGYVLDDDDKYSVNRNVFYNTVKIEGGTITDISGGGSYSGKSYDNSVEITNGIIDTSVSGGYSLSAGSVYNNIITIKGGIFSGDIIGGHANVQEDTVDEAIKANDNTINLYDVPDLRLAYLHGGMVGSVDYALGNTLNVYTKDIVARNISGFENINFYIPATATNGSTMLTLTAGTTDLRGAKINAGVMGGSSLSDGDTVTLITNTADGLLLDDRPAFGKLSEGVSLDYDLTISKLGKDSVIATIGNVPYSPEPKPESGKNSDGTLKFDTPSLSPASGSGRSYSDNVVNIDHDNSNYDVNGERVTYDEAAVYILETSGAEDVLNNEVNVSSGTFTQKVWGAASDSGSVRNNKFTVTGGTYTAGLLGACSNYGDITENSLSLSNVDITGDATGAWSNSGDVTVNTFAIDSGRLQGDVTSARSESGNVSGNSLTINGGHITGDVFGGWSTSGQAYNNTININGGIIDCFIVGGVTADGNSTGNVMNISGSPDLTDAYLVGSAATGTYDTIPVSSGYTGHDNTLNIRTTGLSVQNIAEFDTLNFYLPASTESGDTALTLTSGTTSLEGMTIRAGLMGNSSLTTGDSVTLVNNGNGLANNSTKYEKLSEGVSLDYDLTFTHTDNTIDMLIGNPITTSTGNALKPQTAAIEQAAAVPAVRLMNSVVDLGNNWLQPENFEQENKDVANQQVELTNEFRMFGSMGASNIRTKTEAGGYVDNKNWGMDLGWAKEVDYNGSKLFFAPIVDYGRAKYESNIGGIKGSGSTNYLAGGMILRKMYDSGFYVEGSFRYGRVQMDFASNDFEMMGEKVHVSYDATTPCWAGHLHVGKNFKIDRQSSLNIYGMYHHAHQGGMTANLSTGETYTFDAVDSGRLRVGARITRQTKKNQRFYSGLAYQYEFSGSARAHYKDYVTPDTSTSGSSAMLELGWQYQPVKNVSWVADLNVSGSVGKEEGVKAVIKIKKVF